MHFRERTGSRRKAKGKEQKALVRGILKQRSQFTKTEKRKMPLQLPDKRLTLRMMAWRPGREA